MVTAGLAGGDFVAVAGVMNVVPFFVMACPDIRRVEDLKGRKIGITALDLRVISRFAIQRRNGR